MTTLTLYIDPDLKKQVQEKAKHEGISLSGLTTQLYKSYIEGHIDLRFAPVVVKIETPQSQMLKKAIQKEVETLTPDQKLILSAISEKPASVDTLACEMDIGISSLNENLIRLQLKGLIAQHGSNWKMAD